MLGDAYRKGQEQRGQVRHDMELGKERGQEQAERGKERAQREVGDTGNRGGDVGNGSDVGDGSGGQATGSYRAER
jgi:hypothetical protein